VAAAAHLLNLGVTPYREAWDLQRALAAEVAADERPDTVLLLEHPPVITLGRRPGLSKNILAAADALERAGVEVVESDRGGDVTFHGPGQLVAYPIVRLNDHRLSVGAYVRKLQEIVIDALNDLGVPAQTDPQAIGIWTCGNRAAAADTSPACELAKICAIGVRIRRGVSMHGLALNITTDLNYFDLIIPCGLSGRAVTSLEKILGETAPPMPQVKSALVARATAAFATAAAAAAAPPVNSDAALSK
jgi:lipoate-protein ligase B